MFLDYVQGPEFGGENIQKDENVTRDMKTFMIQSDKLYYQAKFYLSGQTNIH